MKAPPLFTCPEGDARRSLIAGTALCALGVAFAVISAALSASLLLTSAHDCAVPTPANATFAVQQDIMQDGVASANGGVVALLFGAVATATAAGTWYLIQRHAPKVAVHPRDAIARAAINLVAMCGTFVTPLLLMAAIARIGAVNDAFNALGCATPSVYATVIGLSVTALALWIAGIAVVSVHVPYRRTPLADFMGIGGLFCVCIGPVLVTVFAALYIDNLRSIGSAVAECAAPLVHVAYSNLSDGPMAVRAACIALFVGLGLCVLHLGGCVFIESNNASEARGTLSAPRIALRLLGVGAYALMGLAAGWGAARVKGTNAGAVWEASGCTASVTFSDFELYVAATGAALFAFGVALLLDIRCDASFGAPRAPYDDPAAGSGSEGEEDGSDSEAGASDEDDDDDEKDRGRRSRAGGRRSRPVQDALHDGGARLAHTIFK